jgi:hypothetical protein
MVKIIIFWVRRRRLLKTSFFHRVAQDFQGRKFRILRFSVLDDQISIGIHLNPEKLIKTIKAK